MTLNGNAVVSDNSSVTVQDGLTLNGTLTLGAMSSNVYGYLTFTGSQTLGGTGTVVFGQYSPNTLQVSECGHDADDRAGDHRAWPERRRRLQPQLWAARPTSRW